MALHTSRETGEETDQRLQRIALATTIEVCELQQLPDGRMALTEHFTWESRAGSGTNLLEQIAGAG